MPVPPPALTPVVVRETDFAPSIDTVVVPWTVVAVSDCKLEPVAVIRPVPLIVTAVTPVSAVPDVSATTASLLLIVRFCILEIVAPAGVK